MRNQVFVVLLLAVWLGSSTLLAHAQETEVSAAEVGEAQRTATEFFAALQAGNVLHLRQVLGGQALQQYKVLLEQNHAYPAFLRQYYSGATMNVEGVRREGEDVVVAARMEFPDGSRSTTLLRMQSKPGGVVKIVALDEG